MSKHPPCKILYPIQRAGHRIHSELGTGLKCGAYMDALEQRFAGGGYGMERNVMLPIVSNKVAPGGFTEGGICADFTFVHRSVLVLVLANPCHITEDMKRRHWFRLNDTGIPLGLILNFGGESFEYHRIVHQANLAKWNDVRQQWSVAADTPAEWDEADAKSA